MFTYCNQSPHVPLSEVTYLDIMLWTALLIIFVCFFVWVGIKFSLAGGEAAVALASTRYKRSPLDIEAEPSIIDLDERLTVNNDTFEVVTGSNAIKKSDSNAIVVENDRINITSTGDDIINVEVNIEEVGTFILSQNWDFFDLMNFKHKISKVKFCSICSVNT